MKYLRVCILLAVVAALLAAGHLYKNRRAQVPGFVDSPVLHTGEPYLRAAHWFGGQWAINFWNTDLEARARADFETIIEDGFNTIVLLVPWPGFAPDPRSGELDAPRVERLRNLMRLAAEMDLMVILRVSYAYDGLDEHRGWRNYELWTDEAHYQGWLEFLESVWDAVGDEPNLLFGFFSWEDLWAIMRIQELEPEVRLRDAQASGYVRWLAERYSLEEISERYRRSFESWEEVEIPWHRAPAFELFLDFMNWAWIERFFLPAQQRFPKLSMEIRIDADPVYDGDEMIKWYYHDAAWDLPGADWVTLYWAPSMGGQNQGESLPPEVAAQRLEWWLERVAANAGPRQIFIGQFLAEDFTPGYENNGRIPRDQVPGFLELTQDVLARHTGGYGLWTWTDYGHNTIANPEFYAGLAGWEHSDGVEADGNGARLPADEWIGFPLPLREFHVPGGANEADLCIKGRALSADRARVQISDNHADEVLGVVEFPADEERMQCVHFLARDFLHLEIKALEDSLIRRVENVGFVQVSGMRDIDGELKPVGQAYRDLNFALVERPPIVRPMYEDGWMSQYLVKYLEPPEEVENTATLHLVTHLPDNWPYEPLLTIAINGQIVDQIPCVANESYSFPVELERESSQLVKVGIEASETYEPDGDTRRLGCLINELALLSPDSLNHASGER